MQQTVQAEITWEHVRAVESLRTMNILCGVRDHLSSNCVLTRCISLHWLLFMGLLVFPGCATWLPSGESPKPIEYGLKPPPLAEEAVVIETIVLRLNKDQQNRLHELWNVCDQQILSPEQRLLWDKNGMRLGKLTGSIPSVLETWLNETEKRAEADPLEKTGLTADVVSVARQWRCRADSKKEIPLRDLGTVQNKVSLFYYDGALKGRDLDRPRMFWTMTGSPVRDGTANVTLSPDLEHGEYRSRFIVRDNAVRPVSEREKLNFEKLAIELRLQRQDCLVIGPTFERKGVGAEFLHSLTVEGHYEPVLLLVRYQQSGSDNVFNQVASAK